MAYLHCCIFLLLSFIAALQVQGDTVVETTGTVDVQLPTSDPRKCFSTKGNTKLRMAVLPGGGWDNLENKDMGPVVEMDFSSCLTTSDNKYIIPDNVHVIPIKDSRMEWYGEIINDWQDYKSMTSSSINAGLNIFFISGSFSADFAYCKSTQVNEVSSTARVQVRHMMYTVRLIPGTKLHPTFKSRLLAVASKLQSNQTEQAQYLVETMVRDYGTNVITKVNVGAVLAQEDYLKKSFFSDSSSDKSEIKGSISASFFGKIGLDFGGGRSQSESFLKKYNSSITSSRVITHGGRIVTRNFSMEQWEDSLDNALVAIDRDGDPLHFIITPESVPELPPPLLKQVTTLVKKTVDRYYDINTHHGCTGMDSPNFDYQANLDDGSCKTSPNNFTFGGVYQECSSQETQAGDLCHDLVQMNPITGTYGCPPGYDPVKLNTGDKKAQSHHRECHQHCSGWWIFKHCHTDCGEVYKNSKSIYNAYWCVARGPVRKDSGYLFGGVFTSTMPNPITRSQSCPSKFYPLRLGSDMKICVSDDYELGFRYSVPFAGFFSCNAGNPLVIHHDMLQAEAKMKSNRDNSVQHKPLVLSIGQSGAAEWPHRCPPGYSQHLATIDEGCEINFCVKVNSLSYRHLPKVQRPPWSNTYDIEPNATQLLYIIGPAKKIYIKNETSDDWKKSSFIELQVMLEEKGDGPAAESLSPGAIAGVAIGATFFVGLVSVILVIVVRKRQAGNRPYQYKDAPGHNTHDVRGSENDPLHGTSTGNVNSYAPIPSSGEHLPV